MNWISNFVRPKIRALVQKTEVPENLWQKCDACGAMIFHRELEASHRVCPHCSHHMRIGPKERLTLLFDEGEFNRIELPDVPSDPLKFRDRRRYSERLKEAQSKTGDKDAVVVAHGMLGGKPLVAAVFNFSFMGGSMGAAVGEALIAAARLAVLQESALLVVPSSGGARMQEGILSLMQMPRTIIAVDMVKDAGLPYLVLLTDPTTGGVSASFAMLGDITIAEPGAVIGFAGARVIEETIRETLPEGFQRSEYLLEHGMIDMVAPRRELRGILARILTLLSEKTPAVEVDPLPAGENPASQNPASENPAGENPAGEPPTSKQERAEEPQDKAAE